MLLSGMLTSQQSCLLDSMKQIGRDMRAFIELSMRESDSAWEEWVSSLKTKLDTRCWVKKNCDRKGCPAYNNACGRCWLIAGTMCGGEVQGHFAKKYKSCVECDVYQEAVFKDPVAEIYEHLIALVHSLRSKQDELKTLATKDLLTGLYNRNYFDIVISKEAEKIKRHGGRLAIVLIDVDRFKYINDTYGHLHGDGVLRECASMLNNAVRSSDTLVRLGGDEFLIVMQGADCSEKAPLIERIDLQVSKWNGKYASNGYELSFSIGCSVLEKGKDITEAIQEADSLMYKHKLEKNTPRL